LTAAFCVVLQGKATASKNTQCRNTRKPNRSPEQKKNPCASCVKSDELSKKPLWVRAARDEGLVPVSAAPHSFVFADSHGTVVLLTESHRSITGGYFLTNLKKREVFYD